MLAHLQHGWPDSAGTQQFEQVGFTIIGDPNCFKNTFKDDKNTHHQHYSRSVKAKETNNSRKSVSYLTRTQLN